MADETRLLLYDDNADLRASLSQLLSVTPGLLVVGAFATCTEAEADIGRLQPHVVLMDIDMPGCSGIEGLRRVKAVAPHVQVVMLTVFEDNGRVLEAVWAGADGYLLKKTPPNRLLEAIAEVRNGGAPMTPAIARQVLRLFPAPGRVAAPPTPPATGLSTREHEVLSLLVQGYSYKMIAAHYFISIDTVRSHIKHIYEKMHVHSMTEAVSKALREGLV